VGPFTRTRTHTRMGTCHPFRNISALTTLRPVPHARTRTDVVLVVVDVSVQGRGLPLCAANGLSDPLESVDGPHGVLLLLRQLRRRLPLVWVTRHRVQVRAVVPRARTRGQQHPRVGCRVAW
jgi:hypothetical protein